MATPRFLLVLAAEPARMRCALVLRDVRIIASAHQSFETRPTEQEWIAFDPLEVWYKAKQVIAACLDIGHVQAYELAALALVTRGDQVVGWSSANQELNAAGLALPDAEEDWAAQVPRMLCWLTGHSSDSHDATAPGQLRVGALDTWLLWNLSGAFVASRSTARLTGLMDLDTGQWDSARLASYNIPPRLLPPICNAQPTKCFGRARARGPFTSDVPIAAVLSHADAVSCARRRLVQKPDLLRDESDAANIGTALIAAESISAN